jgi:hypothetical protein
MIRFLPLFLPLFLVVLSLGFYWGRNHQKRMADIDEPDEPQIFTDGGMKMESAALGPEEIEQYSSEEIADYLEEHE